MTPDLTTSVVQTLVLYSIAEHQLGHATCLRVAASGTSFSVEDNGRGHAIGRLVEGSPYLNFVYGHLAYPFGERTAKPVQLQGLGMSLLNRLCVELAVTVRKTNATLNMKFNDSILVSHELTETGNPATGNVVSGKVHETVAGRPVDEHQLGHWMQCIRVAHPSLSLSFNGHSLGSHAGRLTPR